MRQMNRTWEYRVLLKFRYRDRSPEMRRTISEKFLPNELGAVRRKIGIYSIYSHYFFSQVLWNPSLPYLEKKMPDPWPR